MPGYLLPFILVTTLFFMWGIPNNLNGVLIKQFMKSMEISSVSGGTDTVGFLHGIFCPGDPGRNPYETLQL